MLRQKIYPSQKKITRAALGLLGTFSMSVLSIESKTNNHVIYEHIDGSLEEQIQLVQEFEKYLELRDMLLEDNEEYPVGLPGPHSGPAHPKATAGGSGRDSSVH